MKLILAAALALVAALAHAQGGPTVTLTHLRGAVWVAQDDYPLAEENSAVYVGPTYVTVIGATWTPQTARLLAAEIAKVTAKPIGEVIDTNYNLDRAGGNAYFAGIGAAIVSTRLTAELLRRHWAAMVADARGRYPAYPGGPLAAPTVTHAGDFALQGGAVRAIYLGPSHSPDDIFVWFPNEKVLYGGCVLKEQLGNLALANLAEYPKTLRKLKALDLGYTTIIAGHYSPIHGPELVDQYLALLAAHQAGD